MIKTTIAHPSNYNEAKITTYTKLVKENDNLCESNNKTRQMTESQSKHYDLTEILPEIHDMTKTSTPRP